VKGDDLGVWLTPSWVWRWFRSGHAFAVRYQDRNVLTAIPHGLYVVYNAYRWATGRNSS
jgi:hypothetical protein